MLRKSYVSLFLAYFKILHKCNDNYLGFPLFLKKKDGICRPCCVNFLKVSSITPLMQLPVVKGAVLEWFCLLECPTRSLLAEADQHWLHP